MKIWRQLAVTSVVFAFAFIVPEPSGAGPACTLYDNFKEDIPIWFDNHGHTGLFGPTTGDWEYDHPQGADMTGYHNFFKDNGYSEEEHEYSELCAL